MYFNLELLIIILLDLAGKQRVGGSGVWEDGGPADHDGAGQALPDLVPAALHSESAGPVSSGSDLLRYSNRLPRPCASTLDNLS